MYKKRVLVIGGGIIGCSIARILAKNNYAVTLIEKSSSVANEASGSSTGNLTYLPSSPKPPQWHAIAKKSIASHKRLQKELSSEGYKDIKWIWHECLHIATSLHSKNNIKARYNIDKKSSKKIIWLNKKELLKKEPYLSEDIKGGVYYPHSGWIDAKMLTTTLKESALKHGADFIFNTQVKKIINKRNHVKGVLLKDNSRIMADIVLVSAGAWSRRLDKRIASYINPIRGEGFLLSSKITPNHVISGKALQVTPHKDGIIVGSSYAIAGFSKKIDRLNLKKLKRKSGSLVPMIRSLPDITKIYSGIRPATPDKIPLIGPDPCLKGLFWATGHHSNGILLAPITAELILDSLKKQKMKRLYTTPKHPLLLQS